MQTVTLNVAVLGFVAGPVIAFLTTLVTKRVASTSLKARIVIVFALATAVLQALTALGTGVHTMQEVEQAIVTAFIAFVSAHVAHEAVLKPTGISALVANATKNFGVSDVKYAQEVFQLPDDLLPKRPSAQNS